MKMKIYVNMFCLVKFDSISERRAIESNDGECDGMIREGRSQIFG